jgi:hypothetical protein
MLRTMALALVVLTLSSWNVNAQKAANNWYFGHHVRIDFNPAVPTATAVTTIDTSEGCSAISDSNGNPLFYTDGMTVWNKNDAPMTGGTGLDGNSSSTHSALIVPCSCDKYFIFTTDCAENHYAKGLRYSVVDMSGGLGAVTSKNKILLPNASEKVAGVADGSGGFWVVAHEMGNTWFYSYHIVAGSDCKVDPKLAIISKVGSSYSGGTAGYGLGQMKFSPGGKWLAVAGTNYVPTSFVELFKFDTSTGVVSNVTTGPTTRDTSDDGFYGVEFSHNSKYLYATTMGTTPVTGINNYLYRYNMPGLTGRTTINNYGSVLYTLGALQLAPNGTIYLAQKGQQYLDFLPSPDTGGGWTTGAHFNLASGTSSLLGLPTVVAGDFSCAPPCGTITEPRVTCDQGVFTYTFTVTNNTNQQIEWLLFSTPTGASYSVSPPYIHLGTPLSANGGHTTASVTISNASPGDHICLNVALADKDVVSCCTIQTCFDLCPCLKITDAKAVCARGPNGYTFTATIQNLTGVAVQQLFVVPISPANINVTLSPTTMPIPFPGGMTVTGTITGAGAQPGAQVCLRFVPFGTEAQCCSTKICFDPLPQCHGPPVPPPPIPIPDRQKTKKPKP